MGDVSDMSDLLGKHHHVVFMRKVWGALKLIAVMASAFGGAAWTARGYLDQLATKSDVAMLIKGQQEQIRELQQSLAFLAERETRTETRVEDLRGTMTIRSQRQ